MMRVSYPFLSPEWIEAARAIRHKYASAGHEIAASIRLNQTITGVPFGDGAVSSYVDTTSGEVELELGSLVEPDATISTDYETARALFVEQNPEAVMIAFMSGRIKVEGDLMKVMSLQTTMPATDVAHAIAAEIKAITA